MHEFTTIESPHARSLPFKGSKTSGAISSDCPLCGEPVLILLGGIYAGPPLVNKVIGAEFEHEECPEMPEPVEGEKRETVSRWTIPVVIRATLTVEAASDG